MIPLRQLVRIARFLAIVLGLALAFKLLESTETRLLRSAVDQGKVAPEAVTFDTEVPTEVPNEVPAECQSTLTDLGVGLEERPARDDTLELAWDLGLALGEEVAGRNTRLASETELEAALGRRRELAGELGVPTPEAPVVENPVLMFVEFSSYLAGDPECVAAALAHFHTPRHAALYRFASFVSQAARYRELGLPYEAALGPELLRYGEAAGVPEDIWRVLASEVPADTTAPTDVEAVLEGVRVWIATSASP